MYAADYRRDARGALRGKWGVSILITFIAGLLGAGNGGSGMNVQVNRDTAQLFRDLAPGIAGPVLAFLASIAALLLLYAIAVLIIGGATQLGLCRYNIRLMLGEEQDAFATLFSRYRILGKALGLHLVMGVFVLLWSLLLIVPGIVAVYRYAMAPYLMAEDPDVGIMEAIERSKGMMRGEKGNLFYLHLSFLGWAILAIFTLFIGTLWLTPYMRASEAAFYLSLTGRAPGGGNA
jgi:uncharacterized membrane protein